MRQNPKILVSACLLGEPVRYDGGALKLRHELLQSWQAAQMIVPFCSEIAAGFAVPRLPAEIEAGKDGGDVLAGRAAIFDAAGEDLTAPFLEGARRALEIARAQGCAFALLTDGSPSCGTQFIYDGRFAGARKSGMGVVSALLRENGILAFPPQQIAKLAAHLDG